MHTAITTLDTTIRPRLLVVSARHALRDYDRAVRLPRILRIPAAESLPAPAAAHRLLVARERALDHARKSHDASWSAAEHVSVMTALLHEATLCASAPAEHAPLHVVSG